MDMNTGKFVAYYRVSTAKQGASGLGLEAQQAAVLDHLNGGDWDLVGEFTEVETGKNDARPELAKAFEACRLYKAKLVIAKLDRLSRDAHFLTGLDRAGIEFVCADMPQANRMTITIMAAVAEHEREMISKRTKEALRAAKARGVKLGGYRGHMITPEARTAALSAKREKADAFAARVLPEIDRLRHDGESLAKTAARLNDAKIPTQRGNRWTPMGVSRVLARRPA